MAMTEEKLTLDFAEIKTTVKIIKLIHQYRPSLELPTMYAICSIISGLINGHGRGVTYVGDKAIGKGEIIKMTKKLFGGYDKKFKENYVNLETDKFTSAFFVKFVKETKTENKNFSLVLEDMSQIIDTHYLALQCYDTVSKLIWDKTIGMGTQDIFAGDVGIDVKTEDDISITVNSFTAQLGMTNVILKNIKNYKGYSSMWKDRISEFFPIVTEEEKRRIDDEFNFNPDNPRIPAKTIREELLKIFPNNLQFKTILPMSKELREHYKIYRETYKWLYSLQHTDNRGTTYFNGDLSAHALLNGRDKISISDILFMKMFFPNVYLNRYRSTIQRVVQNCLYCSDIYELRDMFGYSHEKYIKEQINDQPHGEEIVLYQNDIVELKPDFKGWIDMQQAFIKECLRKGD